MKRVLASVFFRSFCVRALWNPERVNNIGWLWSYWPVLKKLYPDARERGRAALEHGAYFSTHPYAANMVLGVAAALEEAPGGDREQGRKEALAAKKLMGGPLAALGETFFWRAWYPFTVIAAMTGGWFFRGAGPWPGPVLFLALYNLPHVGLKAWGLAEGYRAGRKIVPLLMKLRAQRAVEIITWAGVGVSAGGAAALCLARPDDQGLAWVAVGTFLLGLVRRIPPAGFLWVAAAAGWGWSRTWP